ncbi:MAG: hypothetical protein LBR08_08530 [Bacteroidales bacterium]|jgi:hypothetical protein|nr:hypothetical protein [Bacteroidales bacterium]
MKHYILIICWLCTPALSGQEAPQWIDGAYREMAYPGSAFLTGFASEQVRAGDYPERIINRLKLDAKKELSENIRVKIQAQTSASDLSVQMGGREDIMSIYRASAVISSDAEIVGVKVDAYYDRDKNRAYAFAFAGKNEVTAYYGNQVSLYLSKVEGALETAAELAGKGAKGKARTQCEQAVRHFAMIAYAQDLLTAIDPNADDSNLQMRKCERLRNELIQTLTDLENSIYVFVECKETVEGEEVVYIADKLPALLTENDCGCNFTESEEDADYVVKVDAYLARCTDAAGGTTVFCWADATVSLYNVHTQKTLKPKIDEAKGGWTGKNYTKAGEEAFDKLAKKIAEKVIPMMKN